MSQCSQRSDFNAMKTNFSALALVVATIATGAGCQSASPRAVPARAVVAPVEPILAGKSQKPSGESPSIRQVSLQVPEQIGAAQSRTRSEPGEPIRLGPSGVPLNLVSALAATDARSPQVEFARWRVREAYAQAQKANVLWLPHLRVGVAVNRHEGSIQDVAGNVFDTSRGGYYAGLGPHSVGQGSPAIPGVYLNVHSADAIFQPKITDAAAQARGWNAETASCDEMLETATLYLDLLRAEQEVEIARELVANSDQLVQLTGAYARAGQGLESDFERAKTELSLRQTELLRAEETAQVASTRLAVQLRMDPLEPILVQEPAVVPLELIGATCTPAELVAEGLAERSELAESRWLVDEAARRLQREKYAPLLPSVLLGVSYGGMAGGVGGNTSDFRDRLDADAIAYWEARNFGLGDQAARKEASARIEQTKWRQIALMDRIAGEIIECHTRVHMRGRQIATAESGVAAAVDSRRRNLSRIENAQGLPIEAMQSVQALSAARRELLRTIHDYNIAQFQLLRALGGGGRLVQAVPAD